MQHKSFLVLLWLVCLTVLPLGSTAMAQEEKISESKREMNRQVSQDKAMSQAKQDLKTSSFKGSVRKQVEYGHAAFGQEQYAVALDRYLRAYEKESDSTNRLLISFMMGQCQQRLNHPKAASQHYNRIWASGERSSSFMNAYVDVLFAIGNYAMAEKVLKELENTGEKSATADTRRQSLQQLSEAEEMQRAFGLKPEDIILDTNINTAFSEYGPTLVKGRLYFSSSRPEEGQVLSDPRTGQGYSRLFVATYNPETRSFVDPRPVTGEITGLHGNVGTFSYDEPNNVGYFTWTQGKNTGIFTVQMGGEDDWTNRQVFLFNYKQGSDDFLGKVAHPAVSPDGNRLLFVYRDPEQSGGTDIWYVEKKPKVPVVETKKKKKTSSKNSPSKATPTSTAAASRNRKKQPAGEQIVEVNPDWGLPVRLSDAVNSPGRESFPHWLNDTMFAFSSDGHVGNGGMDLYLAIVDGQDHSKVVSTSILPRPLNSSYDDDAIIPVPEHDFLILASNRYTTWGKTESLYNIYKSGLKHEVFGDVYTELRVQGPASPQTPAMSRGARGADSLSRLKKILASDSVLAAGVHAGDSAALRTLDERMQASKGVYAAAAAAPTPAEPVDTTPIRTKVKDYYIMVTCPQSGFYQSVSPDTTGHYKISYLDPGDYVFTVYSASYKDCKKDVPLHQTEIRIPVMLKHQVDFVLETKIQPKPKPKPEPKKPEPPKPKPKPEVKPVVAQKKPANKLDNASPKELIKALDTTKRFIPGANKRTVEDYKNRINDPMRRFKLTVVPSDAKCEICGEKDVWKKNAGESFYVKSGDDKALISLIDPQGRTTYVDLAPNAAYGIQVQKPAAGSKGPKLPTGVDQNDIRRKVVTRDYVLFECTPKLSELNDEYYINNVYFDFNKSDLIKDGPRELDRIVIVAIKNPNATFIIETNADERGSEEYNKKLTDRRLDTVMKYVEKRGLDMSRVIGRSLGESNPLFKNAVTDEQHRLNRRTTFKLVNNKAKNIKRGDATYPVAEVMPQNNAKVTFMVQIGAFAKPLENPTEYFSNVKDSMPDVSITYYMDQDGYYKYCVGGVYNTIDEARAVVRRLLKFREAYIAAFYKGQRITVSEALKVIEHEKRKKQ